MSSIPVTETSKYIPHSFHLLEEVYLVISEYSGGPDAWHVRSGLDVLLFHSKCMPCVLRFQDEKVECGVQDLIGCLKMLPDLTAMYFCQNLSTVFLHTFASLSVETTLLSPKLKNLQLIAIREEFPWDLLLKFISSRSVVGDYCELLRSLTIITDAARSVRGSRIGILDTLRGLKAEDMLVEVLDGGSDMRWL